MPKYHINPKTGEPGVCTAEIKCDFDFDEAEHFDNTVDARKFYETKASELVNDLELANKKLTDAEEYRKVLDAKMEEDTDKLRDGEISAEKVKALHEKIKESTDLIRHCVQDKQLCEAHALKFGVINEDDIDEKYLTRADKRSKKGMWDHFKKKSEFSGKNMRKQRMYRTMIAEFTAWSGLSRDDAKAALRNYDPNSGMTRDEYVVSLFQKYNDNGKEMAFVDLETTGFHPSSGEIIEIGIVRVNSKGEVLDTIDERYDMENSTIRDEVGTGAVDIHKINPEDIAGKKKFRDPEVQDRIGAILNDPDIVVSAHNAGFENNFFNHYLDGYYEVREQNSYENISEGRDAAPITDTRNVAMFFTHGLSDSKLSTFSEGNGIPYVDAHSALPDADMSMRAFFAFKNKLMNSPTGKRPEYEPLPK